MPRRPKQPCSVPGCPELTTGGRCTEHARRAERDRGTKQQRGYDAAHEDLRMRLLPYAIGKHCPSCGYLMLPGQQFHLMHNDDRTGYLGMGHAGCNLSDAGKASHRRR